MTTWAWMAGFAPADAGAAIAGLAATWLPVLALLTAGLLVVAIARLPYLVTEMVLPCSAAGALTIKRPLASLAIL